MEEDLKHIYDVSLFNINDLDVLLHELLKQIRDMSFCEAGAIYVSNKEYLKFHVFQNDALSYEDIYRFYHAFKDFKFPLSKEDNKYLSVDTYLQNKTIFINKLYSNNSYDFSKIKEFDKKYNYKTKSIISLPIIHPIENKKIGVIQLINKKVDGSYCEFTQDDVVNLEKFVSFISISILKAVNDIDKLNDLNDRLKQTSNALEEKILEEIDNNENKSAIISHPSKMASMGEMIGNIEEKYKDSLNTIATLSSGISLDIQFDKLNKKSTVNQLDKIVATTKKLSSMIEDFKGFYNIDSVKETFNICTSIKDSLNVAKSVLDSNKIKTVISLDEEINAHGLKNEFVQSILNLITNAKDNIIKNLLLDEKRLIFIDLYKNESQTILKITDNSNFCDDSIEQIFNSQNISSDINENSMGLFMTKLIIENEMNGSIKFENISYNYLNEQFKGTQFIITLA